MLLTCAECLPWYATFLATQGLRIVDGSVFQNYITWTKSSHLTDVFFFFETQDYKQIQKISGSEMPLQACN